MGGQRAADLLRSASSPVVAVDPGNRRRLLLANRIERPRFGCEVFASHDGGRSWTASKFPLPRTGDRCYAPSVAFAGKGRARLLLTMLEGRGNEPVGGFSYESRDGGLTFGQPRQALPPYTFQTSLTPGRDGTLYLSALAGSEFSRHATFGLGPPPNPVSLAVSRDGGASFSKLRAVSAPGARLLGGPVTAVRGREVFVLYWDYGDDVFDYYAFPGRYRGHFKLVLAASHDGGRSFREHVVEPSVVPPTPFLVYLPPLPALAVDERTGVLYAAWEDRRAGAGDVLVRRSSDGGSEWSAPQRLFDGPAQERTPALLSTGPGRVVAAAYRLGADGRADLVARSTRDGGQTFTAPATLTRSPFDARLAPRVPNHPGEIELGSKLGLGTGGGSTFAAWADTRTGSPETGKVDIFITGVPEADLPAGGPLPAAGPPSRARPPLVDRRLRGACSRGRRADSRRSSLGLVGSFVSALDARDLRSAYGYLDSRWREGRGPVRAPHAFRPFAASYRSITCARLAQADSYDRSEDGKWNTVRAWIAVRRGDGPTRLMFGNFWTHSDTARPPWSLIGFWTRELAAR